MQAEKLVYMANQVGKFFAAQGAEAEIAGVREHLEKFWDPRMRREIVAHLKAGGAGLAPNVRKAVAQLKTAAS